MWVVAHDDALQFDREDHRVICELTQFAAAAYERMASMTPRDVRELLEMQRGSSAP